MASLLDLLRQEARFLTESELPSNEELRAIVGALVSRTEREHKGSLKPPPVPPDDVPAPNYQTSYVPPTASEEEAAGQDAPAAKSKGGKGK